MLLISEFKADLFQLKHSRDADALLDSLKIEAALVLGLELVKLFPYEKVQAFEGVLPEMSLNKDHEFTDTWKCEVVVITREQWGNILRRIAHSSPPETYKYAREIGEFEIPQSF